MSSHPAHRLAGQAGSRKTSDDPIAVIGARKANLDVTQRRLVMSVWIVTVCVAVVLVRLISFGVSAEPVGMDGAVLNATLASRPAILDRNGVTMALDIRVPSLYAEPRNIVDVDEAVAAIGAVLPRLDTERLRQRLSGNSGFAWIARELTPQIRSEVMRQGIPGLDFLTETRRFYPAFNQASHVLGAVNVDNAAVAGIEAHIDEAYDLKLLHAIGLARGASLEPVTLSIDMRVQHVLHGELVDALSRYEAVAAAGAVVDIHSGEVLALVSLPDFDPNEPASMLVEGRFNRMIAGKFEPASIFKPITIAGALDAGAVTLDDEVDARHPVRFGRHSISDYYGKNRMLSVPEVLVYSSNVGTVRIVQAMGKDAYRAYLSRMGFDAAPSLGLPEGTTPVVPRTLSEVAAATISFGHGLSVTPMQVLRATAALVNGGMLVEPTLLRRDASAHDPGSRVLSESTSLKMRYLLRLNALEGSARRAEALAKGYRIGGKTGTAEKVVNGRYSNDLVTTFFSSVFPLDAPRYAMLVMVDEPKPERAGVGRTAAYNAGDVTGRVVARIAPMLGVLPRDWTNFTTTELASGDAPASAT